MLGRIPKNVFNPLTFNLSFQLSGVRPLKSSLASAISLWKTSHLQLLQPLSYCNGFGWWFGAQWFPGIHLLQGLLLYPQTTGPQTTKYPPGNSNPPGQNENRGRKSAFKRGYVSSQEGLSSLAEPLPNKRNSTHTLGSTALPSIIQDAIDVNHSKFLESTELTTRNSMVQKSHPQPPFGWC